LYIQYKLCFYEANGGFDMKRRELHAKAISIFLMSIFLIGIIPQVVWAGNSIKDFEQMSSSSEIQYELDHIYIFYDADNEIMRTIAEAVFEIASFKLVKLTMVPIQSYNDLKYWLLDEPWVAIYALSSNLTHVILQENDLTWFDFYKALHEYQNTHHIVGMGNAISLDKYLTNDDEHILRSETEQTDALILIINDIWSLTDIIETKAKGNNIYRQAADDMRRVSLKIYGDHFNDIFKRTIEPIDVVGEVDPVALEERTQAMWEKHAPTIRPANYRLLDNGSLEEIPEEELPKDFSPIIKLSSPAELAENGDDYSLGELPFLSALRGPIGDIVDILLSVLSDSGDTEIAIDGETMETVREIIETIKPIIGIVSNYDSSSPIKSIVQALAKEFPFLEEYKPYLEVLLKCLFSLRGDTASIIGTVTEAVISLLPELFPGDISEFIVDMLGVNQGLGDVVADVVQGGKGVFDTLLSFFVNHVLTKIYNKTLVALFDLDQGTVDTLLPRLTGFTKAIIDYLSTWDFQQFIEDVGTELLIGAMGILTEDDDDLITAILSVIKLGFAVNDMVDTWTADSIVNVVSELAIVMFGESNMTTTGEELARSVLDVVKTYKEEEFTDIEAFKTQVSDIVSSSVTGSVNDSLIEIIVDTVTMIGGFYNSGFDANDIPSVFQILMRIVAEIAPSEVLDDLIDFLDTILKPILGIIAAVTDSDPLRKMVSQTLGNFESEIGAIPGLIVQVIYGIGLGDVIANTTENNNILIDLAQMAYGIIKIVQSADGASFEGVMHGILIAAGALLGAYPAFDDVDLQPVARLLEAFFPDAFGIPRDQRPRKAQVISEVLALVGDEIGIGFDTDMLADFLEAIMETKDIFTKGVRWLLGLLFDWLSGELTPLLNDLANSISETFAETGEIIGYHSKIPVGIDGWNLFDLTVDLGLIANFDIDPSPLFDMISSLIFDAREVFSLDTLEDFFIVLFRCISITPQFYAELGVEGFDTSKNPMFAFLLESFGLELTFSGHAHFILNLFTFKGGIFEWDEFMKVVEWGFNIKIGIARTFTFLDFVTGGGAGALNAVAEYIGLDAITVTVFFAVELDIVKKAATAIAPEVSTLTVAITIGATAHIGFDLIIVEIAIDGTVEIILTFFQDLASSDPMTITLQLIMTIKIIVDLGLIDKDWEFKILDKLWDISPKKGEDDYEESGIGFDSDGDGLGDEYEATLPGFNPQDPDTDHDGANDKLEVQTMYTDGTVPDTDGDGLLDGEEWELGTNPRQPDTDWDDLTDYEEVRIYGTDPGCQDTDGDGLTDEYEVFTSWDLSNCTPTVTEVTIGGTSYNDHTDPLNPDTDGDGLVDGDEGPMAPFYGLPSLYNDTEPYNPESGTGSDPNPVIFNNGHTHPLDADTDDDSYLQLYNGVVDSQADFFLKDMNDGNEVFGFIVIFYDEDGMPYEKRVFTNPCNPDTDGDTGVTDRTPQAGFWLNSDGYELAQTPPTDPNNADSDGDGLIDGIEGVLNPLSNHTNPNVADTDADGLFDMQEILLGCDPRSPDTDGDLITDGDEYYKFHTNPLIEDTDFDALKDGEEVFLWHSNPLLDDSDGDALRDGDEVLRYGSDPVDEDTDNDGLTDWEEVLIYYTDPFEFDTDTDGLSDGEEIEVYRTDPLNWDTDGDSITEPNAEGKMTWPMSDYDEVMVHGTNATETDTDLDGLSDAIELYLGAGEIPWMDPIPLDPLDNDTDDDWLIDGTELQLMNVSDIIYPYISITIVFKHETSPTNMDTDNDTLTDYQELMVFYTDANNSDTDNDTLDDWSEVWVYNTSALTNDTDGDGLEDNLETVSDVYPYGPWPPSNWSVGKSFALSEMEHPFVLADPIYETDALDWDCDDDWLPDGGEVLFYGTDPLDNDTNDDGTLDTYEFDTDFDGLPDGLEYKIGTVFLVGGGVTSPDSDGDGILDGAEYYIYGTDPLDADSDNDGYPDGYEIAIGMDPLACPFFAVLVQMGWLGGQPRTTVSVYNYTPVERVWYRYMNDTTWSGNVSLEYDSETKRWVNDSIAWAQGDYELQLVGENANGTIVLYQLQFTIAWEIPSEISLTPFSVIITMEDNPFSHKVTISVLNQTTMNRMWYQYQNDTSWSDDVSLSYDSDKNQWVNDSLIWTDGTYDLRVFGEDYNETVHQLDIEFTISWKATWIEPCPYDGSPIVIMTPVDGADTYYKTDVRVLNFTSFSEMTYKYRNDSSWSSEITLSYNDANWLWYDEDVTWSQGSYDLEVIGRFPNGTEITAQVSFTVLQPTVTQDGFTQLLIYSAAAAGAAGISFLGIGYMLGKRRGVIKEGAKKGTKKVAKKGTKKGGKKGGG
jgi:hypothetical protein